MTDTSGSRPRASGRSPNYPGLSLGKAVDRLKILYQKEGRHPASVEMVAQHFGYKSGTSGPATTTHAALKKFGLIDDEGSGAQRRSRITELGHRIIRAPEEERRAAIKESALLPTAYQEMRQRFPDGLPSEENLLWQLETDMGFTQAGARDFLRKYRQTMSFAGLDISGSTSSSDTSRDDQESLDEQQEDVQLDEAEVPPVPPRPGRQPIQSNDATQAITLPLVGGSVVVLEGEFPIDEAAWGHLMAVLDVLKPGLVRSSKGGSVANDERTDAAG